MVAGDWVSAFTSLGWSPEGAGASAAAAPPLSSRYEIPATAGRTGGARPVDPYLALVKDTAGRHGLNPSLLAGIWDFESGGNAGAINKSSRATGLGQVMPREAGFPDRPTQQELLDPKTNAEWSARILKSGLDRYGSEDKALAAYLGAIDARGNITGAVDANGTGGNQYIRTVRERQQKYADLTGGTGPGAVNPGTRTQTGPSAGDWTDAFRKLGWSPEGGGGPGGAARAAASSAPSAPVGATTEKQAVAASWALSQLGSKAFYNLCQRFIEQAYGTGGQFGSAAAAGKALFKTADPAQADVGDLVFFRPDASNGYAGHAAIYLGNGEMVGATNAGVTRDNLLTNPYWRNLLVGFGDPPSQWSGRSGGSSTADLTKGAQQLVQTGQRAAGAAGQAVGAVGRAAAAAGSDWVAAFQQLGWQPGR